MLPSQFDQTCQKVHSAYAPAPLASSHLPTVWIRQYQRKGYCEKKKKNSSGTNHFQVWHKINKIKAAQTWHLCVSERRDCESCLCSQSDQSLALLVSEWSQLSSHGRCVLAAETTGGVPVETGGKRRLMNQECSKMFRRFPEHPLPILL